jgi:hypothetical protein
MAHVCFNCNLPVDLGDENWAPKKPCSKCFKAFEEQKKIRQAIETLDHINTDAPFKWEELDEPIKILFSYTQYSREEIRRIGTTHSNYIKEMFSVILKGTLVRIWGDLAQTDNIKKVFEFIKTFELYKTSEDFIPGERKDAMQSLEQPITKALLRQFRFHNYPMSEKCFYCDGTNDTNNTIFEVEYQNGMTEKVCPVCLYEQSLAHPEYVKKIINIGEWE